MTNFLRMKKTLLISKFLLLSFGLLAQDKYQISADLVKVKKDRVKVVVQTPRIKEDKIAYVIPAVIPGSYSLKDFGRFISKFKAYDLNGKSLKVEKEGNNVFNIYDASKLVRIEYLVNDSWDAEDVNYVFQPGGTNIEAGKNYVINHHGFFGYFDGYKMLPYEISINKPKELYASTALEIKRESLSKDILFASDYVKLVDNPVMYSIPDTSSFMSGNTRITVSVYSKTGIINAKMIQSYVMPLAESLTGFFGQMPVDKYHFIMYFPEYEKSSITRFGGYGALEHSYSSFYFLPELDDTGRIHSMISGVASHEFLHILTPLNIHSEEIGNFDFRNPKMSQHLWMYEGVTEYFSNLVQVRSGQMSYTDFIEAMKEKIKISEKFPPVSFTQMSRDIITDEYKDMYSNVYNKGALIGFLLDIRLNELSKGKMELKDIMMKLSEKYGPNKSFKDEELFNDIVSLSFPEIRQFFNDYVIGNAPLPYGEYFKKIGWNYYETRQDSLKSFGMISFKYDAKKKKFVTIQTTTGKNAFGLENDDVILAINEEELTGNNYEKLLLPIIETRSEDEFAIICQRGNETLLLKAKPVSVPVEVRNIIENIDPPSEDQRFLRNKILKTE